MFFMRELSAPKHKFSDGSGLVHSQSLASDPAKYITEKRRKEQRISYFVKGGQDLTPTFLYSCLMIREMQAYYLMEGIIRA